MTYKPQYYVKPRKSLARPGRRDADTSANSSPIASASRLERSGEPPSLRGLREPRVGWREQASDVVTGALDRRGPQPAQQGVRGGARQRADAEIRERGTAGPKAVDE